MKHDETTPKKQPFLDGSNKYTNAALHFERFAPNDQIHALRGLMLLLMVQKSQTTTWDA